MEKRIIDTTFGKVMAGLAGIAAAAGITLATLKAFDVPVVFEAPSSISGVVTREWHDMGGHYRLTLDTGRWGDYNGYEFGISNKGADAEAAAQLDKMISAGSRVTIDGLPTNYFGPFLGPLSPSQVKVER